MRDMPDEKVPRARHTTTKVELRDTDGVSVCTGLAILWAEREQWGGEVFQVERAAEDRLQSGRAEMHTEQGDHLAVCIESIEKSSSGGERTFRVTFRGGDRRRPSNLLVAR
jgi:hypothetical protein